MTESERGAVRLLLGRTVAFRRSFVDFTGSVAAALMLSQAWYWTCELADERDGWFFKSQEEWEAETGLTRYEQEGARKKLSALGLMEERRQGLPARLWFRMDADALIEQLSRLGKNPNQECEKPAIKAGENPQPYIQRLQPEITTTPTLPTVAAESAPTREGLTLADARTRVDERTALIQLPRFVMMGKKAKNTKGLSLAPDSVRVTESGLQWAQGRGYTGDLAGLQEYAEACVRFRKKKGERFADWEAELEDWLLRDIKRGPSHGGEHGDIRTGPAGVTVTRPAYGYNEAGQPTNRATALAGAAARLEERQRARRMAGQDGADVVTLSDDEWRELR